MADVALHRLPDPEFERVLAQFAEAIDWPSAAPVDGGRDVAAVVRDRIAARRPVLDEPTGRPAPSRRRSWWPARRALVLAIIALLALAAVVGAAALGLPRLRIILGDASASPPPTVAPGRSSVSPPPGSPPTASPGTRRSPVAGFPGASLGLGRRVDLADLDAEAGFRVRPPSDRTIGPPDAVYVDDAKAGQVTFVWASRPDLPDTLEPGIGLLMTAFQGSVDEGYYSKVLNVDTSVQLVLVGGNRAYWLSGDPHFFFYEGPHGPVDDSRRWVGDALLWADGPITYRLETSLGRDRAIDIAGSVP